MVPPTTSFFKISLAVRVVIFVICLMENSIAIFILYKGIRKGRKTFARCTLLSVACADILSALLDYPEEFVKFTHGDFVWLVQGQTGDVLCKIYAFLAQIPGKVVVLCLVALACDVTRNLSTKGRREHTRKFSAILMVFFWIIAAGLSAMYFVISKVEYKLCNSDPAKHVDYMRAFMIDLFHSIVSFMFVFPPNLILMILNPIILHRVRRRKKELITRRRRKPTRPGRNNVRRQRRRTRGFVKNAKVPQWTKHIQEMVLSQSCDIVLTEFAAEISNPETLIEMSTAETNGGLDNSDVHIDASSCTDPETLTEMSSAETNGGLDNSDVHIDASSCTDPETLTEMSSAETNGGLDNSDVHIDALSCTEPEILTEMSTAETNEALGSSDVHIDASSCTDPETLTEMSSAETNGGLDNSDVHIDALSCTEPETLTEMSTAETNEALGSSDVHIDASSCTDQSSPEESLEMTKEEAKIESATSFLLVIISITLYILPYVCDGPECSEYVVFAIQIAVNIYAAIKPGIYAIADKEFRERYKQLSPFACCCFRRIRCHTVPQQVGTTGSLSGKEHRQCVNT
ncbi:uncharacterized protein LOC144667183 [Oculina patagonica]